MTTKPGRDDAAVALEQIGASRARLANQVMSPVWWWPAQGVMWAAILVGAGSSSHWVEETLFWLFLLSFFGLDWLRTRLTGSTVRPWSSRKARPWFIAHRAVVAALFLGAVLLQWASVWLHAPFLAAGLIFLSTLYFGDRIDRAMRSDLLSAPVVRSA